MTLLTICQNAASEIGLDPPFSIVGNSESIAVQLKALARRSVREIGKLGWPQLQTEYQFTTFYVASQTCTTTANSAVVTGIPSTAGVVAGFVASCANAPNSSRVVSVDSSTQVTLDRLCTISGSSNILFSQDSYPLPSDYLGMVDQTQWDRTNKWQLLGPLEAQEWQVLRSGLATTGPRFQFRLWNNKIYINPPPARNSVIVFEYVSRNWIVSAAGIPQSEFTSDSDTLIFDEDLAELDLIWRFKKAKGLAFAEDFLMAQQAIERDRGRLMSGRVLNLASRRTDSGMLGMRNIPDTGFGQ